MTTRPYPGATWAPIPESEVQASITPVLIILHTIVGTAAGAEQTMRGDSGTLESHFVVPFDGKARQLMPLDRRADCNWQANAWTTRLPLPAANGRVIPAGTVCGAISIETEDDGTPADTPWTPEQVEWMARFIAWARVELGIPIAPPVDPFHPGVGYHSLPGLNKLAIWDTPGVVPPYGTITDASGRTVNVYNPWTTAVGKSCPGAARSAQFPAVIARARVLAGTTPPPLPTPTEDDMIALDYQRGFPDWTALVWTGTHLGHIIDGNASALMTKAGVKRLDVNRDELYGLIRSSVKTTPCPTTLDAELKLLWA